MDGHSSNVGFLGLQLWSERFTAAYFLLPDIGFYHFSVLLGPVEPVHLSERDLSV